MEEVEKAILWQEFLELELPNSKISIKEFIEGRKDRRAYILEVFDRSGLKAKTFKAKADYVRSMEQKLFRCIRNNKRARELAYELLNA